MTWDRMARELVRYAHIAYGHQLLYSASGNMSVREGEHVYITRAGSFLGFLSEQEVVTFHITDSPPPGSSHETRMHLNCYHADPRIGAVFHSQPPYAALVYAGDLEVDQNLLPETMGFIRDVGRVSYAHPTSIELAEAVGKAAKDHDIILLTNHGLTVVGRDLNDVMLKTMAFEYLCRVSALARQTGVKLNHLPESVRADMIQFFAAKEKKA